MARFCYGRGMSKALLKPLLRSPELVEHVEELNRFIAIEQHRRRRFYEEITEEKKWEFINGEVVMHSPARNKHNLIVMRLAKLLSAWCDSRDLGQVTVEKTLCAFPRNDYEPDVVFFGTKKAATIRSDTLLHPIPDFVAEVLSNSTRKNDRGIKLSDYEAHGVAEYWIIDPVGESVEQFIMTDGKYGRKIRPLKAGQVSSKAVAGFEIPVRSLFEAKANNAALRKLLD